jgi:hypothetical protein
MLDPDQQQSEEVEALEGHLDHWRVQILGKVGGRIHIKFKGRIRIRINVMRIRNTAHEYYKNFINVNRNKQKVEFLTSISGSASQLRSITCCILF